MEKDVKEEKEEMRINATGSTTVLADFTADSDHPFDFQATYHVLEDEETVKAELGFEWHYLRQALVDKLEEIFLLNTTVDVYPDTVNEPSTRFTVVWTSTFDFYSTTRDWSQGWSGAVVFTEL